MALLRGNADPLIVNKKGQSALDIAKTSQNQKIAKILAATIELREKTKKKRDADKNLFQAITDVKLKPLVFYNALSTVQT